MSVKFVFSSVPMGTQISGDAKSVPVDPENHDHHYQVKIRKDALRKLVNSKPLRLMFTQAAYKALRDGNHDSASLYVSVYGVKVGRPNHTMFDDASNHHAVQGVVDEAMQMAAELAE